MDRLSTRRAFLQVAGAGLFPGLARAQPRPGLRIRAVDPYVLRIGSRADIVRARIETQEGIHGWGEGTTPPNAQPAVPPIRSLGQLLVGDPAWDHERPRRRMYTAQEN